MLIYGRIFNTRKRKAKTFLCFWKRKTHWFINVWVNLKGNKMRDNWWSFNFFFNPSVLNIFVKFYNELIPLSSYLWRKKNIFHFYKKEIALMSIYFHIFNFFVCQVSDFLPNCKVCRYYILMLNKIYLWTTTNKILFNWSPRYARKNGKYTEKIL